MPATSLQLIDECQRKGILSKEAADQLRAQRARLIKTAVLKQAGLLDMFRKKPGVVETVGDVIKNTIGRGGTTGGAGAGWSDVGANLAKMMALTGLAAGGTAAVHGIMRHSRDKKLDTEIQSSYHEMFNEHPKLHEIEEEKPGMVRRHFNVLARYAPSMAANPTVAGAWVQQTTGQGAVDPAYIKNIADTQGRIDENHEARHGMRGVAPVRSESLAMSAMKGG